jgi:hypothetical protein
LEDGFIMVGEGKLLDPDLQYLILLEECIQLFPQFFYLFFYGGVFRKKNFYRGDCLREQPENFADFYGFLLIDVAVQIEAVIVAIQFI